METPGAVLFDAFGTLLTTEGIQPASVATGAEFFQMVGLPPAERPAALPAIRQGHTRALAELRARSYYLHRDLFAMGWYYAAELLSRPITRAEADGLSDRQWERVFAGSRLREGAAETLSELRARGFHVGVVSNSDEDQLERMLEIGALRAYLDSSLCSETARSCKPDPAIFRQALGRADCLPSEAVFVGDTPWDDVGGAAAVGMRTVLIQGGAPLPNQDAPANVPSDYVIQELPELLTILA